MKNDLLFELGTEELPSAAVLNLSEALKAGFSDALSKQGILYGSIQSFATPRRLAVLLTAVDEEQPSQKIERKGPSKESGTKPDGSPSAALEGFAKSCGVAISSLMLKETPKGTWWCYEGYVPGKKIQALLPDLINQTVKSLPMAKPMRWGEGKISFARPIHWALLLYGNEVIRTSIMGVMSDNKTFGHRFHHPEAIEINHPSEYEDILDKAFVIASFEKRKTTILKQIEDLIETNHYKANVPDHLLNEVTSIVEWPQALLAHFDDKFLNIPPEVLVASMQSHQKCFALSDQKDKLQPYFITISNIQSKIPDQVVNGNEKVMRARLSDAAFFYENDKRLPLENYWAETEKVIFQKGLGTLQDKARRIGLIMQHLSDALELDPDDAQQAAYLSKCDLLTGMVNEFPELQGLMGCYYAKETGVKNTIAIALSEQYMPRFAGDDLPKTPLGVALSLADRLDTLVGSFATGQKPTASKDPYKLRRHALAVVRLLMQIPIKLSLTNLLQEALESYGDTLKLPNPSFDELKSFILERLIAYYESSNIPASFFHAVKAKQDDWLFDLNQRIQALVEFAKMPEALSLSAASKRVNNLLQQAKINLEKITEVNPELFQDLSESALFDQIQLLEESIQILYVNGEYSKILHTLASLREKVDAFFEHVMVMSEDERIRNNRLYLLARLNALLQGVADISLLSFETPAYA